MLREAEGLGASGRGQAEAPVMLREAEGIRASGRGQAEAPVMLREAKHLWLARTFRLTDGGGAEASNGAGGAG